MIPPLKTNIQNVQITSSHVNPSHIAKEIRRVFEDLKNRTVVIALGQVWRWEDGTEMTIILFRDHPHDGLCALLRSANDFRVHVGEAGLRSQFTFVRAGTAGELAALATAGPALQLDPRAAMSGPACPHPMCRSMPIPIEPPKCSRCPAPATVPAVPSLGLGPLCVYCAHATAQGVRDPAEQDAVVAASVDREPENVEARRKRDAADRRLKPTSTASSRELAKRHPWESEE